MCAWHKWRWILLTYRIVNLSSFTVLFTCEWLTLIYSRWIFRGQMLTESKKFQRNWMIFKTIQNRHFFSNSEFSTLQLTNPIQSVYPLYRSGLTVAKRVLRVFFGLFRFESEDKKRLSAPLKILENRENYGTKFSSIKSATGACIACRPL